MLDLGGLFLDQRNLFPVSAGRTVAVLEVVELTVLVSVGQNIARRRFGHPGGLQLVQQGFGRFFEFICKLSDGRTGHLLGNLS